MPKSVSMSFSPIQIGRGGIEEGAHFEVREDDKLFGRLTVTRKRLRWWPHDGAHAVEANWTDFDAFMRARAAQEPAEA